MSLSRRSFLLSTAATLGLTATAHGEEPWSAGSDRSGPFQDGPAGPPPGLDPWLEIDAAALAHNAAAISRISGGRPVLGVVKNNAYGLGLATVGPLLDSARNIGGLAVVKAAEAIALRDAGVSKPILLMGLFDERDGPELVARDVQLSPYTDSAPLQLARLAKRFERRLSVHLYLDTGMSRLGMPYHRAVPWIADIAAREEVGIESVFMTFTEEDDFDAEQLRRFLGVVREVRQRGIDPGLLHAASSHALFYRPDAMLDMVRPGLTLYGAFPAGAHGAADLRPAFRLRARVVRVERLRVGDSVSYGREYVATRPTWIATLPVGHADGYPRQAVNGCEVLAGGRLYPVIGAVSASHTIIEVGDARTIDIGDEVTLIGPDNPAVHPNVVAERTGLSVYDILMHLSQGLPKRLRA